MPRLFISHASEDDDFVNRLLQDLHRAGLATWIDHYDIPPGKRWYEVIEDALDLCEVLLFIVSHHALHSSVCSDEWSAALSNNKTVIPVMLESSLDYDDLPFLLKNRQAVDFRHGYKDGISKLLAALEDNYSSNSFLDTTPGKLESIPRNHADSEHASDSSLNTTPGKLETDAQNHEDEDSDPDLIDTQEAKTLQIDADPESMIETRDETSSIQAVDELDTMPVRPETHFPQITLPMLEWCDIPAGRVRIEARVYEVDAFRISKYPVTVAQYEIFIQDDGYNIRAFWTQSGWTWKKEKKITAPDYWDSPQWHIHNHPVVGVSWHEAIAFCRWFSEKTTLKIMLPTEQQWQRASQGDDGREYPWGSVFDKRHCNTQESRIGSTTPVDRYPTGKSPADVYDMSGNVLEWCLNHWRHYAPGATTLEGNNSRVLRGGSWQVHGGIASTLARGGSSPTSRGFDMGFRLCLSRFE